MRPSVVVKETTVPFWTGVPASSVTVATRSTAPATALESAAPTPRGDLAREAPKDAAAKRPAVEPRQIVEKMLRALDHRRAIGLFAGYWPLVAMLASVLERGRNQGLFRDGVDPIQLYISIAALCFFYLSNSATLSVIFGRDLLKKDARDERLAHMVALVLAALTFWIGGFDLIYACQDVDFDRRARLHSFPARFGVAPATLVSASDGVSTCLPKLACGSLG